MENDRSTRVFLDVGANTGQTLAAVLDPSFRFDRIICFEPVPWCWKHLDDIADDRVRIERFGLWNKNGTEEIFNPASKGGSLWKKDNARSQDSVACSFRRASDWFRENINPPSSPFAKGGQEGDLVWLKLNCEGAECDILDDLLDSGEFEKVTYAMVDFDVRKIASQKHRQAEVMAKLAALGIGFPRIASSKQVMVGDTHAERIKNWLRAVMENG